MAAKVAKLPVMRHAEGFEAARAGIDAKNAECMPEVLKKFDWGAKELILDHGCATGKTCLDYIAPMAEKNESTVYALDNCAAMIKYAKEQYSHPSVKYVCGELTSEDNDPVKDLKFNKIFSLYTLHFVSDFRRELKALYDHLEPNGEMYMITVLYNHGFELFKNIRGHEKWEEHAKDHVHYPTWVDDEGENAEILKTVLLDLGFEIKEFVLGNQIYVYDKPGVFADLLFSLNSFAKHLPEEHHDELKGTYHNFVLETETDHHKPHDGAEHNEYKVEWHDVRLLVKKPGN